MKVTHKATDINLYFNIIGGFFKARLIFPHEYPLMPPKMIFDTPMWHPNGL